MSVAVSDTTELVLRAAQLRAGGGTWESIARKLDLPAPELRRLLADHRASYRRAIAATRRDAIEEGFFEAVFSARRLLRSDDEKVAERASASLFRMFASLQPHPPARTPLQREKERAARHQGRRADEMYQVTDYLLPLAEEQVDALLDRAMNYEME